MPPHFETLLSLVILLENVFGKPRLNVPENRHPWVLRPFPMKVPNFHELFRFSIQRRAHHPIANLVNVLIREPNGAREPLHGTLVVPRHVIAGLRAQFAESSETGRFGLFMRFPKSFECRRRGRAQHLRYPQHHHESLMFTYIEGKGFITKDTEFRCVR